jgi:hypothetical protein
MTRVRAPRWAFTAALLSTIPLGGSPPPPRSGMRFVRGGTFELGTTPEDRARLAAHFGAHPSWLADDTPRQRARLPGFWIDERPVSNGQYLAFCRATGRRGPEWWKDGAAFPAAWADHPVVGVSGLDARAYAEWAGKRLPTAEEWEAAFAGAEWPAPAPPQERFFWSLPPTRPLPLGQSLEWVEAVVAHHGVRFRLLKGVSWLNEDPLSFRAAAGWYFYEGWSSATTGFRCAADGTRPAPRVASVVPEEAPPAHAFRPARPPRGPLTLASPGGQSRWLVVSAPALGPETVRLFAPETIAWNERPVLGWRDAPRVAWTRQTPERLSYEMALSQFSMRAEFIVRGEDAFEQVLTVRNATAEPATFYTNSCLNLQTHPLFYDFELLRTYALDPRQAFVPMRRFSRGGACVRWIAYMDRDEMGPDLRWALMGVTSRGRRAAVIGTGRAGPARQYIVATNPAFTCLHADSSVDVPANGTATTRQMFYFLAGGLDTLRARFVRDFGL